MNTSKETVINVAAADHVFLGDGGEMGRLIRAYDWTANPLGNPSHWPQSLKTAVRLMLTSRHPMFIWWGQDLIQLYNDAYRLTMGPERHPSALGQRGRDCWAEIWPIIGPQIELVMRGEGSTWHEEQLVPVTRHGALQNVWWTYGYSPIDHDGGVGGVLVVCNDVTEQHLTKEALASANERLSGELEHLRDLFVQAPGFIAVLRGPEHIYEFANDAYEQIVGQSDLIGRRVIDVMPELKTQGFITLLDCVFSSGQAHVGTEVPIELRRRPDGASEQLYLDFVYQPIRDAAGHVTGIFVEGYEVTSRVVAARRQDLLAHELHHRVRNTLATVQAVAMLTAKSATTVTEYKNKLSDRLQAMAKTQALLVGDQTTAVGIEDVLKAELEPYLGRQVMLECQAIEIESNAAVNLSLLVHELLTNAAKYGALSSPDGKLVITCERRPETAVMTWDETTPQIKPSNAKGGFGTQLIQRLATALGGEAKLEIAAKGLRAVIVFKTGAER